MPFVFLLYKLLEFGEKGISFLAGNLDLGRIYLITTVLHTKEGVKFGMQGPHLCAN